MSHSKSYLGFLDGLRCVAVVAVILYHLDPTWLANGYLGVDVFFAISGFVVSYAVSNRGPVGFWSFLVDFYSRRITRIYPALIVCLLVTTWAAVTFIPDAYLNQSMYEVAKFAFFGLSNLKLASGNDYFSPLAEFNPFTHTWSLGVEEQFYLVFPVLFFAFTAIKPKRELAMIFFAVALGASATLWFDLQATSSTEAFYQIYTRFWELSAGVLLLQLIVTGYQINAIWLRHLISIASLAALAFAFAAPVPVPYLWVTNVAALLGTLGLIWSSYGPQGLVSVALPLASIPARFVGRISYSLYLWHWPVIVMAKWTVGIESIWIKGIITAIFIGLAVASYYLVEQPFRRVRNRSLVIVATGFATIAAAWFGATLLIDNRVSLSQSTVMRNSISWHQYAPSTDPTLPGCTVLEIFAAGRWDFTRTGCDVGNRQPHIFAVGDSHAGAYVPMLARLTLETGTPVTIVSYAGCPYLSLMAERDRRCRAANDDGMRALKEEMQAGDLLFLPSLRIPRLTDQWRRPSDEEERAMLSSFVGDPARPQAVQYAVDELGPLMEKGVLVVFEAPKPVFYSPTFRCADWFNQMNPICKGGVTVARATIDTRRAPVLDAMESVIAKLPGVRIWDPMPVLCPYAYCRSMAPDGTPYFFDGDHLSAVGSRMLLGSFKFFIEGLRRKPYLSSRTSAGPQTTGP